MCKFILIKGINKGKQCSKKSVKDTDYCSSHTGKSVSPIIQPVSPIVQHPVVQPVSSGCKHVLTRGKNKGETCGKKVSNSDFCSSHSKKTDEELAIKVEDIELFYKKSNSRQENGSDNRIREDILSNMEHKNCRKFYQDPVYGKKWKDLRTKFYALFDTIPQIEKTAGMKNDFDFLINGNRYEFKFNATSVFKLPQHVQLRTNNTEIIPQSYAEYYYDNFLSEVCEDLEIKKLDKNTYLDNVHKHKCENITFFDTLKKNMNAYSKRRVNDSIDKFLEDNCSNINIEYMKTRLKASLNKTFIMYDLNTESFISENVSDDFSSLSVEKIKNKNTIVLASDKYKYELLLRWKNGIGILNPAWQIKIKN